MAEAVPWIVAGRYEVGEVVGSGGYGMVRRGIDRKTGEPVAMKVLSVDAGKDPHQVERMLREQQAMVAMAGTCAVSALDMCRLASGAPCLVMEWLDGRDLESQLTDWEAAGRRQSNAFVLDLMRPLTETLQRAHELGIVHRDIKPANVFLTAGSSDSPMPTGAVRLLDFGLSRMRSAAPITAIGMVMGSPSYIPPETWRGNSSLIDYRADLYSLAVIVFRLLAGRLPFETPSLVKKLELVTTGERPSVCALRPNLPASADDWMRRALAIEPDQRFQSAREFYDALTLALHGSPFAQPEEVSGVRPKASVASVLPTENRNVLSLAWERATSLLQRFIGRKAAARTPPPPAPTTPPEASAVTPRPIAASTADAELMPQARPERPTAAWLNDGDVEDLPPESALPVEARAITPAAETKPKLAKVAANEPKKKPKAPKSKHKQAKPGKASKKPARAQQAATKKGKPSRKKR
jgi:eukaryotic-like serine/threonine-protein kinase